jgi:hypothetical protein
MWFETISLSGSLAVFKLAAKPLKFWGLAFCREFGVASPRTLTISSFSLAAIQSKNLQSEYLNNKEFL